MGPAWLMASFLTSTMTLPAATGGNPVSTQNWIFYHNTATGISFRYPPSLRIQERNVQEFGLPDAELIVDLVGDTAMNPGTVVLRFIVNRGVATPQTVAERSRIIRKGCQSTTTMLLDGHQALVCVYSGRAATHWKVEVLYPRECTILTLLAGADSDEASPPPHDGTFPLLSIIKTLHFEPAEK
jgi:hypothetical protein